MPGKVSGSTGLCLVHVWAEGKEGHTWRPWAVRGGKNSKDHHVRPSCSAWASFSVTFILRVSCRFGGVLR